MTTAHKTAAKKATNPAVVADTLKTVEAGKEPQAIPQRDEKKDDKRLLQVSEGACVTAMQKALGFGKASLHLEIAIALTIFVTDAGVHKTSKDRVMGVYKEAGFDSDPKGEDYKTCHRRMTASSKLFVKMGRESVLEAIDGAKEGKAIENLKNFLTEHFNFSGINAVIAEATGIKPKQTNTATYRQAKADEQSVAASTATVPAPAQPAEAPAQPTQAEQAAPKAEPAPAEATAPAPAEPTPADKAVMAQMATESKQGDTAAPAKKDRRASDDRGILLIAGSLQLAIPYGTPGKDVFDLYAKLTIVMASLRDDTVVDEKFDRYSTPVRTQSQHVAH